MTSGAIGSAGAGVGAALGSVVGARIGALIGDVMVGGLVRQLQNVYMIGYSQN